MRQRGKASAAALSVVTAAGVLPNDRLGPPPELGERETAEWYALVDRMGSDWFPRETQPLLAALCAVKVQLDDVNEALAKFPPGIPTTEKRWARYRALTRLRGSLGTQLATFCTKLRLTPQAQIDRDRAGVTARNRAQVPSQRPWNDGDGADAGQRRQALES